MILIFWFLGSLLIAWKFLKPGESLLLRILWGLGLTLILGWLWLYFLADRQLLGALLGPVTTIFLVRLFKMGKSGKAFA